MIQVTDGGDSVLGDPGQGPFDGADDTLIGVVNSSASTVTSIAMSSDAILFGFDGDGLCTQSPQPAGCPFGSTGYEGPGTSFSLITPDQTGGVVSFSGGLAPGATAYFSLEAPLTATTVVAGGPSLFEQGGAPNESENSTDCSSDKPVNCATGVFWHQFTDFTVPGRGVPLSFSRAYSSSRAGTDGPLGFGWTDNYNMSLSTDSSGNVTVHQEDGSMVTFTSNGAGGFTAPPRVLATLAQNSDGSFTFTRDRGQTSYHFSAAGQLASITDLNGYTTTLSYTGGNLTSVTDPAGRQLTVTYTGSHIASVTDPLGRTISFTYDASGNLTGTTDAAGRTWSFSYDSSHQLLAMTDPRGGTTSNVYNGSGQVSSQTDPRGGTTTFSYAGDPATSAGGTTTMTDPNGNVTTYTYSSLELTSATRAAGTAQAATTSYAYDPATLGITSVTDPNGNITTSTYDTSGNLLSTTDPLGNSTSYTYNNLNEMVSKSTPLGETTSYTYDASGNLLSSTDALGNVTSYTYAGKPGDVTGVTDPNGSITSYTYDANGDIALMSVSPSAGVTDTTAYAYDADGERTCQASPNATAASVTCPPAGSPPVANTTATTYNPAGEVTSVTDPDGRTTTYAYDGDGNLTQVTPPNGQVTSYTYNGDNQQTKITRPDGTATSSGYDASGNVISQTDAAGNATTYTYDALNRLASVTNPLGQTTRYGYDAASNRTSLTDPSGAVTTYSYDAANRLTGITYSGSTTPAVSYTYDANGQRASMTDGTGTSFYSYDSDQRLTGYSDGFGNLVGYTYDPAGRLTSLLYPNGQAVTRAYDGANRLTGITDWLGNTTTFGYDANGNVISKTYPNGVTTTAAYDNADQVTSLTDHTASATLAMFAYTRDNMGQVTSDAETGAITGTQTYSYNQLSQLASSNGAPYGYDAANNLTQQANGTTQSFNAAGQLTSAHVPAVQAPPASDTVVSGAQTSKGTSITSPALTTKHRNELLLAFVSAGGPAGKSQKITSVTGGGLTWTLLSRADHQPGTAEVWQAHAAGKLSNVTITAALSLTGRDGAITVASFTGAKATAGAHAAASGQSTAPKVSLTTTGPDSLIWAAGEDASQASAPTPASGQAVVNQVLDTGVPATYWAQRHTKPIARSGTRVTIADTLTAADRWNLAAAEITAAPASPTTVTYSYDTQGNLTGIAPSAGRASTFGYDEANRLTSPGTGITYAYNGDGLRLSKTVNGATTTFAWDLTAGVPTPLTAGTGLTATTTSFIYGPNGQPVEQITGSTPAYLLGDQQGSTRLLTNSAGAVTGTYSYGPYGAVTRHTGAATALQYDGQFTDAETGLVYLRARYYDPATGQFITADPLTTLTRTPYGYAADDPVNSADLTGLCSCDDLLAKMKEWAAYVQRKAGEMEQNPLGLPLTGPTMSVESHVAPWLGYQAHLIKLISQYIDMGCGTFDSIPDDILEPATRPVPVPSAPAQQPQPGSPVPTGPDPATIAVWGITAGVIIILGVGLIFFPEVTLPVLATSGAAAAA